MRNLMNPPQQYSKHLTRGEKVEKCQDEALEPIYYFSAFRISIFG